MNETTLLVGYVRKTEGGQKLKLSINKMAFEDCQEYSTSDGQTYIPLTIDLNALRSVLQGERAVTTIQQVVEE